MKSIRAVFICLALAAGLALPVNGQSPQPASSTAGRLVLTTNSAEAKAEFWKGMEEWQTGTYTSATRHFARAYALDNNFALAHLLSMGEVQARQHPADRDRAVADAARQSTEEGLFALFWREKSVPGNAARTRATLAAAMQLMPNEPSIATEYLWSSQGSVDDAKKALDSARLWRGRFPNYTPVALPIAYLNLAAADTAAALRAAEEYTRIASRPSVAFGSYGAILWNLGRYDQAETQFRKGIGLPGHPDYGWDPAGALAELYMVRGRYTDARAVATEALSRATDADDSAFYTSALAGTYFATGDNRRAMQLLQQAREKRETVGGIQNPFPLDYALAQGSALSGDLSGMRSYLGRIRPQTAQDSAVLNAHYAFDYLYAGQLDSVPAYSDRLAKITSVEWTGPTSHRVRGLALVAAKQCARARSELTQAADTVSPQMRLAAAECELQAGNRAAALGLRDRAMSSLNFVIFVPSDVRERVRLAQIK
jgi:tetratricopeptide (TPR) repeat protein